MRTWTAIIALFCFLGRLHDTRADVTLVRDGKSVADIVVSSNALSSVRLAAEDLCKHIALISGAELTITNVPSAAFKNHIYVGPSEFTRQLGVTIDDLKPEGFRIVAKDQYVVIIGRDEQRPAPKYPRRGPYAEEARKAWRELTGDYSEAPGSGTIAFNRALGIDVYDATATFYAAAEFLEQLGVRWYAPYEDGTVIPRREDVVAAEQDIRKEPAFPHRGFNYYRAMEQDAEGVLWFKRMKYGRSYAYSMGAHTTRDILTPEQEAHHPEYYAMAGGQRIPGRGNDGVPRLMDPAFRKASVNYMNKAFEAYPEMVTFSLGMPDGFTQIDERDAKIWDRPDRGYNGMFSDYVWDYWLFAAAELKKSHPDKYLTCFSYTTYTEPPSQIETLPDNVALQMSYGASLSMLPEYAYYKNLRDQWLAILTSRKFFIYEFCLDYRKGRPTVPVVYTKIMQAEMQKLDGICEGKQVELMPWRKGDVTQIAYPALTHLRHYLQGKLYWDPDLDLQTLLDEYYHLYFGPAHAEMKEFYEFAEDVWTRPETRSITIVKGFLKEADVDRYFDLLARARAKAGADTVYDRRIARIESEMEPLKKLFAGLKRTGPDFRAYLCATPFVIDGQLDEPGWNGSPIWYTMRSVVTGEPVPSLNSTRVAFRFRPDRSALVVGVKCLESKMDRVTANTTAHDDFNIFNDDVIEIYIETPERSHFKIVVNPNAAVYDESTDATIVERDTLPVLWNPGVKAAVVRGADGWDAEIMIPTDDFGSLGPEKPYAWGINVCRARYAMRDASAIAPTGQMLFAVLNRLGNLYIE